MDHRAIAGRFNARLGRTAGVRLVGGAEEPLYLPPRAGRPAVIRYTRDHAQSALHELAHWCLAAPGQRLRVDYGLWYRPPPRSEAEQDRFYAAEAPVQALEMLLARAVGVPFHFSADNPGADRGPARCAFEAEVLKRFAALAGAHGNGRLPGRDCAAVLIALNPRWRETLALGPCGRGPRG